MIGAIRTHATLAMAPDGVTVGENAVPKASMISLNPKYSLVSIKEPCIQALQGQKIAPFLQHCLQALLEGARLQVFHDHCAARAQEGDEAAARWLDLCVRLDLDADEQHVLLRLLALEWPLSEPSVLGTASVSLSSAWLRHTTMNRCQLVGIPSPPEASEATLSLFPETLDWFCGRDDQREYQRHIVQVEALSPLPSSQQARLVPAVRRAVASYSRTAEPAFAIVGTPGSGRAHVAAHLALGLGLRGLWRVDLAKTFGQGATEWALRQAVTMAVLGELAIAISGLEEVTEGPRWAHFLDNILGETWPKALRPPAVLWLLNSRPSPWLATAPLQQISLALPNREERTRLWQGSAHGQLTQAQCQDLGARFLLSEGQIAQAAAESVAALQEESKGLREEQRFERFCASARAAADHGLGALATPESGRVSLDALILSPEGQSLLEELLSYIENRHVLANAVGFSESLPYGLGVTALFTGPPGTGKSYAAKAIACALDKELYRVDLSQLVSKYIGETEKHLALLFDAAQGNDIILLFDEADAIFAKRTEVRTSVDRYANLEVGYLLQRIERFDGLVILTTNHEKSIDEAFMRRIRFRIDFAAPDPADRLRLWQGLLPTGLRLDPAIDLNKIAHDHPLSGGHIKEVILRAAALALREAPPGQVPLQIASLHLERAIAAERRKLGLLTLSSAAPHAPRNPHRTRSQNEDL